jgi:hypothetical protein
MESHLANVLGVVGNPIPVFYGQLEEEGITIGVKDALRFANKQEEGFEYVEITGAGVNKLQDKIKNIEEQIDKTTFSILKKQESKTRIDAQEAQSKNTSFLTDMAVKLSSKFNALFEYMAQLENKQLPKDAKLEFKTDFASENISLQVAEKLLLAGEMSRETFYTILQTGELPKDFDVEKEIQLLEKDTNMGLE